MIAASLILNLIILVPVTTALMRQRPGMDIVFGADTPARRILLSIYLAIAVISALLLWGVVAQSGLARIYAQSLIGMQIVYKVLTIPLVGLSNTVVRFNIAVTVFHSVSLASFFW